MILHVPFTYFPDPVGGTEIYVSSLLKGLHDRGWDMAIAAPAGTNQSSTHEDIPVFRYGGSAQLSREEVWTRADPVSVASFRALLEEHRPRLVHFHGLTSGISADHVAVVAALGIPWVLTYHTPTVTCMRGEMMRWGEQLCDGRMETVRCTACVLHKYGLAKPLAALAARLPLALSRRAGSSDSRAGLVLAAPDRIARTHARTRTVLNGASRVVAVCEWVAAVLQQNGLPRERLLLSRQGLRHDFPQTTRCAPRTPRELLLLGRADWVKGIDVVIRALRAQPALSLQLKLFLVVQDPTAQSHLEQLKLLAADDPRIVFAINRPNAEVLTALPGATAVLVPSVWLETGPLTVLEAQAAGVPVLGSRLGGIAELVRDGQDGWLLPAGDVAAWSDAFARLAHAPEQLDALRAQVPAPRLTSAVVADHEILYREILGS